MRLEGINAAVPAMKDTAGAPAVQRQIQALQRNLSRLENKKETTEAEEAASGERPKEENKGENVDIII